MAFSLDEPDQLSIFQQGFSSLPLPLQARILHKIMNYLFADGIVSNLVSRRFEMAEDYQTINSVVCIGERWAILGVSRRTLPAREAAKKLYSPLGGLTFLTFSSYRLELSFPWLEAWSMSVLCQSPAEAKEEMLQYLQESISRYSASLETAKAVLAQHRERGLRRVWRPMSAAWPRLLKN